HTLDVVVPAASTDATFYYRDASAGTATLTAAAVDRVGEALPLRVSVAAQAIAFPAPPAKTFGAADFAVSASASSGLPVSFSASGGCTVSVATVHLTGAGSCTLT